MEVGGTDIPSLTSSQISLSHTHGTHCQSITALFPTEFEPSSEQHVEISQGQNLSGNWDAYTWQSFPPGATAMRDLNSEERNRKKTKTSLVKAARHSRKMSGSRGKAWATISCVNHGACLCWPDVQLGCCSWMKNVPTWLFDPPRDSYLLSTFNAFLSCLN